MPPSYRLNIWRYFYLVKDPKSALDSKGLPSDYETPSQDLSHVDLLAVEGRRGLVRFQQEGRHSIELYMSKSRQALRTSQLRGDRRSLDEVRVT